MLLFALPANSVRRGRELFADHRVVVPKVAELIGPIPTGTIGDLSAIVGQIPAVVPTEHDRIVPVFTPLLSDAKLFVPSTIVESFLRFLAIMKDQFWSSSSPFRELPVRFLVNHEVADVIPIADGIDLTPDQFSRFCAMIAHPRNLISETGWSS
jgi:hypothetical protein